MQYSRLFWAMPAAAALLCAQQPTPAGEPKPPAKVDAALRDRIQKFFQAHVDGKYRAAEQYVAEDSKDFFFAIEKPRYAGFKIAKITYSDHFTKATAVIDCLQEVMMPGMGVAKMNLPRNTTWKKIKGQWYWYADLSGPRQTPFGPMQPGTVRADGGSSTPFNMPKGPSVGQVIMRLKPDKSDVQLSTSAESQQEVTITNTAAGWITLQLQMPPLEGLEATLEPKQLAHGQTARLRFHYTPKVSEPPLTITANVIVAPTDQIIPIRVHIGESPSGSRPGPAK